MSMLEAAVDRARFGWHIAASLPQFWTSELNRAAVELVDPQPGELVVDLGAGMGPASVEALAPVGPTGRVLAVDPSRTMRAVLRLRRWTHPGLRGLEVRPGRAQSLPVTTGTVDALWAVNATHHFDDLPGFAHELARVLRPGGRVVLVEQELDHPDHPFARAACNGHHGPPSLDVPALLESFQSAGLTRRAATGRTLADAPTTVITAWSPA